jgi:hypothetical protein
MHMNDHDIQRPPVEAARPRLLDLARDAIRRRHYSYRTEQAFLHWMRHLFATHVLNKGGRGVKSPLDRAEQSIAEYRTALSARRERSPRISVTCPFRDRP